MGCEGVIQAACIESLVAYCDRKGVQFSHYPPYSNQQGEGLNAYCADLVAVLDNAVLLLLEIKEFDGSELQEFREDQHQSLLNMESKGLPVAYCYNECWPLPNTEKQKHDWPIRTLAALKRSVPTRLPNKTPAVSSHRSLLNWLNLLEGGAGDNAFERFGDILREAIQAHVLRNSFLLLLYSPQTFSMHALESEDIKGIYKWLSRPNAPTLGRISNKIDRLRQAAGVVVDTPKPPSTLTSIIDDGP
jgi:hypothetical protein